MKKFLPYSLIVLVMFSSSCKKVTEFAQQLFSPIDVNLPAFQFTIPPVPIVFPTEMSLGSFTTSFNLDSIIKANTGGAFGASAVSTVKIKQMTMSITNATTTNNLANFESARFLFSSNTNSSPVEVTAFSFPDVFATSNTATTANGPELVGYLNGTQLTYTIYGKSRRTTTIPLTFVVNVTLSAK